MTSKTEQHTVVRLEQIFPAAPHTVYRAWLEPDLVRGWMVPGDAEVTRVEIDERVGGCYRIWKAQAGTIVGGFDSALLELVPDERLVVRWGFIGPERRARPAFDSLLPIALREEPVGPTRLSLEHAGLDELAAAMPHVAENVRPGWDAVLKKPAALTAVGDAQC